MYVILLLWFHCRLNTYVAIVSTGVKVDELICRQKHFPGGAYTNSHTITPCSCPISIT